MRLIVSFVLGALIGAERQLRRRDAGLRTTSLICMGSTGAMLLSIYIPQIYPNFLNGDPGRIAAQVITGIGFLGAGAIVHGKGSVQGLTTAANIWLVAVIGLMVGAGMIQGAVFAALLALFILLSIERFESKLHIDGNNRLLIIRCSTTEPDIEEIKRVVENMRMNMGSYTIDADFEEMHSTLNIKITVRSASAEVVKLTTELGKIEWVKKVNIVA